MLRPPENLTHDHWADGDNKDGHDVADIDVVAGFPMCASRLGEHFSYDRRLDWTEPELQMATLELARTCDDLGEGGEIAACHDVTFGGRKDIDYQFRVGERRSSRY